MPMSQSLIHLLHLGPKSVAKNGSLFGNVLSHSIHVKTPRYRVDFSRCLMRFNSLRHSKHTVSNFPVLTLMPYSSSVAGLYCSHLRQYFCPSTTRWKKIGCCSLLIVPRNPVWSVILQVHLIVSVRPRYRGARPPACCAPAPAPCALLPAAPCSLHCAPLAPVPCPVPRPLPPSPCPTGV